MAVTYDGAIIQTFVERLYRRANNAVATYTLLGVGIGLSVGYILAGLLGEVARGRKRWSDHLRQVRPLG